MRTDRKGGRIFAAFVAFSGLATLAWTAGLLRGFALAVIIAVALTPFVWLGYWDSPHRFAIWRRQRQKTTVLVIGAVLGCGLGQWFQGYTGGAFTALAAVAAGALLIGNVRARRKHAALVAHMRQHRREYDAAQVEAARVRERQRREAGWAARQRLEHLVRASDRVLIDTNVWLQPGRHLMLRTLAETARAAGRPLTMIGAEFEEIVRLKGDADRTRAFQARHALRLVETLQAERLLSIERLPYANVRGAYYDRVVQRVVERDLAAGRSVAVVTDDGELRIRIRGRVEGPADSLLAVYTSGELAAGCPGDAVFVEGFRGAMAVEPPHLAGGVGGVRAHHGGPPDAGTRAAQAGRNDVDGPAAHSAPQARWHRRRRRRQLARVAVLAAVAATLLTGAVLQVRHARAGELTRELDVIAGDHRWLASAVPTAEHLAASVGRCQAFVERWPGSDAAPRVGEFRRWLEAVRDNAEVVVAAVHFHNDALIASPDMTLRVQEYRPEPGAGDTGDGFVTRLRIGPREVRKQLDVTPGFPVRFPLAYSESVRLVLDADGSNGSQMLRSDRLPRSQTLRVGTSDPDYYCELHLAVEGVPPVPALR